MTNRLSSVQRQAEKDAYELAAAYMSYGEGAGTRRKLIDGTVNYKVEHVPGYAEAFDKASANQNMVRHASNARRSHKRKQINAEVARNAKAVVDGRYERMNTGVLIVGAALVVFHKTGLDRKIVEFGKQRYNKIRNRWRKTSSKSKPAQENANVYRITDI